MEHASERSQDHYRFGEFYEAGMSVLFNEDVNGLDIKQIRTYARAFGRNFVTTRSGQKRTELCDSIVMSSQPIQGPRLSIPDKIRSREYGDEPVEVTLVNDNKRIKVREY